MGKATKTKFAGREMEESTERTLLPYLARGERGERFGVELLIGPNEAEFLLSLNPDNRKLRAIKTSQFITDMRHGRWHNNGESIIIARTGELNDGQHRLSAVLQSRVPQRFMVCFGYDRDTRYSVDSGAARSAGDHLAMSGIAYSMQMAAVARFVLSFEQQQGKSFARSSAITSLEIQDRVHRDELLREITTYIERHRVPFARTSLLAACFYLMSRIAGLEAKRFIDGLITGANLPVDSPIYTARERLVAGGKDGRRLTDMQQAEILFRTWNYYVTGRKMTRTIVKGFLPALKTPTGEATNETGHTPVPTAKPKLMDVFEDMRPMVTVATV